MTLKVCTKYLSNFWCLLIDLSEANEEDEEAANEDQQEDKGADDGGAEVYVVCDNKLYSELR